MVMRPRRACEDADGARASQRGARRGLADRDNLAGAGGQHGAVPRARLPARPPDRRGSPEPIRRSRLRASARHARPKAAARSWSAAIWERTSRGFTGCFAAAFRFDCSSSGPRHVSSELNHRFDAGGLHPQAEMFLRRDLSPAVAVERVFRRGPRSATAWRST